MKATIFCKMFSLLKGRRWQWTRNCPISRIVAFVEKVCNLGPNRALGRGAGGTPWETAASQTGFTLKHHCTKLCNRLLYRRYLSKKIRHTGSPLSPPSQIRPMKKCIERMKGEGGKWPLVGHCKVGQARLSPSLNAWDCQNWSKSGEFVFRIM